MKTWHMVEHVQAARGQSVELTAYDGQVVVGTLVDAGYAAGPDGFDLAGVTAVIRLPAGVRIGPGTLDLWHETLGWARDVQVRPLDRDEEGATLAAHIRF